MYDDVNTCEMDKGAVELESDFTEESTEIR
mgnify:CR=1 FL=1